ncbi:MAG: IclR family transcriptional regulator [Oscillospiraceae bacterium]
MDKTIAEGKTSIQSVERALDIIEVLSTESSGLGITEISSRVGLAKSTVHRFMTTLTERGYAAQCSDGKYKLGLKLIESVSCYINSLELQTEARPYLAAITSRLGLTAHLGILDGDQVVYIEKMDVFAGVKLYSQIGLRTNAYCSSLGKCLLSKYPVDKLDDIMVHCSFEKFTENTIGSLDELKAALVQVRKDGWAMDNEEYEMGHRCIGAPIFDYRGDIIAAVSASGNVAILPESKINQVASFVKEIASSISKDMGYVE